MARRSSGRSSNQRSSRGNGSNKGLTILFIILGIVIVGVGIWFFTRKTDGAFSRATLDKYVEQQAELAPATLSPGAAVYLDFSNGMNYGYQSEGSSQALRSVVNKLTPLAESIKFFELAEDKITPMENMSQTALYNYIMSAGNYTRERAPIEAALRQIVDNNQPALLVTDYEEYNNGTIQLQPYATKYFISWLGKGNSIYFYKFDFNENGKEKHLYYTVFDVAGGELCSLVAQAFLNPVLAGLDMFVIGGHDFSYPMYSNYISSTQGGTYHNENGKDIISGTVETGEAEAFTSYARPVAGVNGDKNYKSVQTSLGTLAEYYPLTVAWSDILKNAEKMKQAGVPANMKYTHFLCNIFIDFNAQTAFKINAVEARAFVMDPVLAKFDPKGDIKKNKAALEEESAEEVLDVFTASFAPSTLPAAKGLDEISVDFDRRFNGSFSSGINPGALMKVNVVVASATPNLETAEPFFSWTGNPSLYASVKNTLESAEANPAGAVLISYYLKNKGVK